MKIAYHPDFAFHPGETLAETLETLGVNAESLSLESGLDMGTVRGLLEQREAVTPAIASGLERATSVPASFWINTQENHTSRAAARIR